MRRKFVGWFILLICGLTNWSVSAQMFSDTNKTLVFYEGQLQAERLVSASGMPDYNTDMGEKNGVGIQPSGNPPIAADFVTPTTVSVPYILEPAFSGKNRFTRMVQASPQDHPSVVVGEICGVSYSGSSCPVGDRLQDLLAGSDPIRISRVYSISGALSKIAFNTADADGDELLSPEEIDSALSSGSAYLVDTSVGSVPGALDVDDILYVSNSEIGSTAGDSKTLDIEYVTTSRIPQSGTATSTPPDVGIIPSSGASAGIDFALGDSGLFLRYATSLVEPSTDSNDHYYEIDGSQQLNLWGTATNSVGNVYEFNLHSDRMIPAADTIHYTILIVHPDVWGTSTATVAAIDENTSDLSLINDQIMRDRNDDGQASDDRDIQFVITPEMGDDVFEVDSMVNGPALRLKRDGMGNVIGVIDYESSGGSIEVELCAIGNHLPDRNGDGMGDSQCYALTVLVNNVNEVPESIKTFDDIYLLESDPLPPAFVLLSHFSDPEEDSLTFTVNGQESDTLSQTGGYDVTASILGDTVLSLRKSDPGGLIAGAYS